MKINWEVRINNPVWWFEIALAIITPLLAYFGLNAKDIVSWNMIGDILLKAITNPYVLVLVGTSVYNAIIDPTTKGISDSKLAMTYEEPKDDTKVV